MLRKSAATITVVERIGRVVVSTGEQLAGGEEILTTLTAQQS